VLVACSVAIRETSSGSGVPWYDSSLVGSLVVLSLWRHLQEISMASSWTSEDVAEDPSCPVRSLSARGMAAQ
jgi:hypothetical protein